MAVSLYLNQTPPSPAWLSPALSVVKSSGLTNQDAGTPLLDVNPPQTQHVRAEAGNSGSTNATDVHVQFWAHAFATAPASNLFLTSLGGVGGTSHPAGTGLTIAAGLEQPFEEPWDAGSGLAAADPEIAPLLNAEGKLHCCLLGNVHSPADGAVVTDPSTLQVATNPHHAQRNMTISPLDTPATLEFMMFAGNPDQKREQNARLEVAEVTPRRLPTWQLAELDKLGPWIRRTRRTPKDGLAGIEFLVDGKPRPVLPPRRPLRDLAIAVKDAGDGREVKFELGADEARKLHIQAEIPDQEFVLRMFDVTHFVGKRQVGGARLVALTVPEELRRRRVQYA